MASNDLTLIQKFRVKPPTFFLKNVNGSLKQTKNNIISSLVYWWKYIRLIKCTSKGFFATLHYRSDIGEMDVGYLVDFCLQFQESHVFRPLVRGGKKSLCYTSPAIKTLLAHKYPVISSSYPCTLRKWRHESLMWQINQYFNTSCGWITSQVSSFLLLYISTTICSKPKSQYFDFNRPSSSLYYEFLLIEYFFCVRRLAGRHKNKPKVLVVTLNAGAKYNPV